MISGIFLTEILDPGKSSTGHKMRARWLTIKRASSGEVDGRPRNNLGLPVEANLPEHFTPHVVELPRTLLKSNGPFDSAMGHSTSLVMDTHPTFLKLESEFDSREGDATTVWLIWRIQAFAFEAD